MLFKLSQSLEKEIFQKFFLLLFILEENKVPNATVINTWPILFYSPHPHYSPKLDYFEVSIWHQTPEKIVQNRAFHAKTNKISKQNLASY